jgi:hypothetical protein
MGQDRPLTKNEKKRLKKKVRRRWHAFFHIEYMDIVLDFL